MATTTKKPNTAAADISRINNPAIPAELIHFDSLPDTAHVRLPVVSGLYGCSHSTIWRGVKDGSIPAPVKLTKHIAAWNVGSLRSALAARAA